MLDRAVDDTFAWRAKDIKPGDWRVTVPEDVLEELHGLAGALRRYEGPIEALTPAAFELSATAELMARVGDRIDRGIGFALLDRLPVERWDAHTGKAIAFLVTSLIGPVVMQKWGGTRVYDVKDTGTAMGHGVRRSITNLAQEFHTDGGWLTETPEIIALACLRQAARGGTSRVANLANVHNVLRARHGELVPELYRPFWWDRQAEHPKGEPRCSRHPVYAWGGGRLAVRYYDDYIRQGHRLMNAPLGRKAAAALDAMQAVVQEPENWIEFRLEPGQIECVNNRLLAHARTAFHDSAGPEGRHLLRLWVRRTGDIALEPGATVND
jgi:alpha-ketoglutarate-dependent taurine dioxygenase